MERIASLLKEVAWGRLAKMVVYAMLSIGCAYLLQPWFHRNESAFNVLITVFSILAGFIVAVTAIVADERALRGRNWRQDVHHMKAIRSQLIRHHWTFQTYLAVLVLLFFLTLAPKLPDWMELTIEYAALGIGMFVLLASFSLPSQLMRRQLGLLRQGIKDRRAEEDGPAK